MGYIAKLECGKYSLDLNSGPYSLLDFSPPALVEEASLASGTSANRYGGAQLMNTRIETGGLGFTLRVLGNSNAQIEAAIDRVAVFLRKGSRKKPVYFVWRPNNTVSYEPLTGQWNASRRCQILHGRIAKSGQLYGIGELRSQAVLADVSLTINAPEGREQWAAAASGGIFEDWIGTTDGMSRGVIVAEGSTNLITNPIFGNTSNYLQDWSAGADIIVQENIDPEYVLFGKVTPRLLRPAAGSGFSLYQSINVGDTNTYCLSFYVKKQDGSAVTSDDIMPRYGGTTAAGDTYLSVGNGWYRVWKSFTGIASSQVVGVTPVGVTDGTNMYVDMVMFELGTHPSAPLHGDLPGCTWSGTQHASSSTRTGSTFEMPTEWQSGGHSSSAFTYIPGEFTWWCAFKMNYSSSEYASLPDTRGYLMYTLLGPNLSITDSGALSWTEGTNGATSAADALAAGEIVIVHASAGPSGMKLYLNGSLADSDTAYIAGSMSTIYMGYKNDGSISGYSNVTLLGAGMYGRVMSATEVSNDYANMTRQASGGDGCGQRVDWLSWFWTRTAADNTVDQYSDSTHSDYAIIGGVPGSLPAKTYIDAYIDGDLDSAGAAEGGLLLSLLDVPYPDSVQQSKYFQDMQGTVVAGALGGQVEQLSVSTTAAPFTTKLPMTEEHLTILDGRELALLMRMNDAGDNLLVRAVYSFSAAGSVAGEWKSLTDSGANYVMRLSDFVKLSARVEFIDTALVFASGAGFWVEAKRSTGGASNVSLDYIRILPRPCLLIRASGSAGISDFHYNSSPLDVLGYIGGATDQADAMSATGDVIEVWPERHNFIISSTGDAVSGTGTVAITEALHYNKVRLTPRWAMA